LWQLGQRLQNADQGEEMDDVTSQDIPSTPARRIALLLERSPQAKAALAQALVLPPSKLADVLKGHGELSLSDLVTAADVLDVPVTYLAGQLDSDHSLAVSLRLGHAQQSGAPEQALAYAHTLIRRLVLLDLWQGAQPGALDEMGLDYSDLFKEAGQRTAGKVRDALELGDRPIADLVGLVEGCGIPVVFQLLPENLHGINVRDEQDGRVLRAIVVSSGDYWTRQRFTLAHELCHDLYDDEGQVIVDEVEVPDTLPELRAESFARHLLLPSRALADEVHAARTAGQRLFALVAGLLTPSGVSRDVILKALVDDGYVPDGDERLAALRSSRVEDLMEAAGLADVWRELCERQHEPSGSPWLVERAVRAYGEGLVDMSVVVELLGEDEQSVARRLAQAGWQLAETSQP